jgi:Fe-Mn family superoxide dismutase
VFTLPELPYSTTALEPYLSAETFEYHHGKHHATYVKTLNDLVAGTELENASLEDVIMKSDGKVFNNAAQIWNHNLYWVSMSPNGGGAPKGAAGDAITKAFGDYETFKKEFTAAAVGQFGSGWAWLVLDGDNLKITATSNADLPMKHGQTAILTCDVWEHAYYVDYRNRRPDYVTTFLDHLINWDLVDKAVS